jgi:hypothetical protein
VAHAAWQNRPGNLLRIKVRKLLILSNTFILIWLVPSRVATPSGFKYFIGFTDKYSNYTWAYLLKKKSEATSAVIQFYQETIAQGFRC